MTDKVEDNGGYACTVLWWSERDIWAALHLCADRRNHKSLAAPLELWEVHRLTDGYPTALPTRDKLHINQAVNWPHLDAWEAGEFRMMTEDRRLTCEQYFITSRGRIPLITRLRSSIDWCSRVSSAPPSGGLPTGIREEYFSQGKYDPRQASLCCKYSTRITLSPAPRQWADLKSTEANPKC